MNPLDCPTRACSGEVELKDWEDNDYCSFAEGDCPECLQKFWAVKRGERFTLRIREEDEDTELFDQREENRITNNEES